MNYSRISRLLCLSLVAGCSFVTRAADLLPSDFLPPPPAWRGASEALVAASTDPWITPGEKTGLTDTPNYEETVAYLARLTNASPVLAMHEFGRTSQGRPLYVVVASKDQPLTPEKSRANGKPILLAQAGIHSGEIDGKDAGLMLLRDIALRGKSNLLDKAHFLFVPVFNADGHERSSKWNRPNQRGPLHQGWRTTAQNLNLNRDYIKADAPEMRGMLQLINEWSPSLYLDLHVTDGADYQYDITFGYHGDEGVPAWSPRIGEWLDQVFRPGVEAPLKAAGHIPGRLVFERDERDPLKGLSAGPAMPRFSHGYGDLRHMPSILVENHSLKPYRQRVLGTCVLLESALRTLGARADELRQAIAADSRARPDPLPINWGSRSAGMIKRDFLGITYQTYTSPATGGTEIRWLGMPRTLTNLPVMLDKPGLELRRPKAYWIPVSKPDVIERLKLHGISMEVLPAAKSVQVEMYRLLDPKPRSEEAIHPFEGRYTLKAKVKPETRTEIFPAGSVRVSTDQPLGALAMAMLEPDSNDSFVAWGFFPEILQRTEYIEAYALAPMAEKMLKEDPKLASEFETKLRADSKFAADPTARLQWFYERSPYYDNRYLLYPVGIER